MVIAGGLATVLALILPVIQIGGWISEEAVWILWTTIPVLVVAIVLLAARLAAVNEKLTSALDEVVAGGQRAKDLAQEVEEARAALEASRSAAGADQPPGLGTLDQALADQLYAYASDPNLLRTLGSFFPYQIPMEPVRLIDELSELPMTRTAHDGELNRHVSAITGAAELWRGRFLRVASADGDFYSTRLREHVPEEAYQQHATMTDELGDAGFDLHDKLLEYQKYYASL
ncbi:MAG TPA: hypothetical protein DCR63_03250 [Microbacterium sp.]|nr:hypothetical protein [Microbacterium sp.]